MPRPLAAGAKAEPNPEAGTIRIELKRATANRTEHATFSGNETAHFNAVNKKTAAHAGARRLRTAAAPPQRRPRSRRRTRASPRGGGQA